MILTETPGPREEYNLVEIRIFPSPDERKIYPVELEVLGVRSFPAGVLRLDRDRLTGLAVDPPAYGRALGEMLFAGDATGNAFRETLAAAAATPFSRYVLAQGWERLAPVTDRPLHGLTATEVELLTRSRET